MTTKLYYQDAEISSANVHVIQSGKDGTGYYVILDQSFFYPEGGGQPADAGKIGPAKVIDVQTVDGEIRHYTDSKLPTESFSAQLDWHRRYDHMQQHAGQHLLSALLEDLLGLKTQSFHLGKERVSIDLDLDTVTLLQLQEIEKKANARIAEGLKISTSYVDTETAKTLKLRKPPAVEGDIRLVKIDEVDLNPCGGTHPKSTAEIGLLKIISTEKNKGGLRIYFLCGNRALNYFTFLLETTNELVVQLNAPITELTQAAQVLLNDKTEANKTIKNLQDHTISLEAQAILPINNVVEKMFEDRPIKELQQLARLVTSHHPSVTMLLMSTSKDEIRFVCAKGEQVEGDMRNVLNQLLTLTEGKGGGNSKLAQGGGKMTCSIATFSATFHEALTNSN
ncbi:alanyl-tRNA editing protein [Planococcus versutus]|uniref:Alanyl-tRNA editing protein n=1 Tax=Planococcus versutus TaxID=1302659 RepID=A0A1B1S2F9_9BACL|nr:DHHA1 domain-containing protein [Planococcus versutus]ANU27372.1 alanyl-tRNA editing protein [Planococcus versutus]